MSVELKGVKQMRKALRLYTPELAKETTKEMARALKPIVAKARGYLPAPNDLLSNMLRQNKGRGFYRPFPAYDYAEAKRGIKYSTSPSRPNRRGFSYAASIYNASASGAIVEVAGRKSGLGGRPVNQMTTGYKSSTDQKRVRVRGTDKSRSASFNPNAGAQFIKAIGGQLVQIYTQRAGRPTHKRKGRLIFRAWAEDQGKANAAVIIALETASKKFRDRTSKKAA